MPHQLYALDLASSLSWQRSFRQSLGDYFLVESHTVDEGFRVEQDLKTWVMKDDTLDDWRFPLEEVSDRGDSQPGTKVEVRNISEDLQPLLASPEFVGLLENEIARAYSMFLEAAKKPGNC